MIRFSKYIWFYFFISAMVLIPGLYSLVRNGLRQSVDFTGGTIIEVQTAPNVEQNSLIEIAQEVGVALDHIEQTESNSFVIRLKESQLSQPFQTALESQFGPEAIVRQDSVGPTIGKELLAKALTAGAIGIVGILLYVAYAFRNIRFGISAVLALVHDVLVVLGVFSILGKYWGVEVDTLFITAILTTMSFSVHDTIVIFDRIREYMKRREKGTFDELCDRALTETMNRSLTNSLTIVFMLLALILLGGITTKWFITALLIGTISGTYSSPFVATPILILWDRWENKKKAK